MNELKILRELGFSLNEAKCYIALHKSSPMTGYEVAKKAKITRTMVYDILQRLERKGSVNVIEGNPKLYSAVSYKKLIASLRKDYTEKLDDLESSLEKITREVDADNYILNLSNHAEMLNLIANAIKEAKREIYLSLWDSEAALFENELREADGRGVKIYIFSFCKMPFDFGVQFTYKMKNANMNFPRRRIIGVFDREFMVMGEGNSSINEIGITTRNIMLMEMSIDQMLLDIILLSTLRNGGYIWDGIDVGEYYDNVQRFFKSIELPADLPLRVDE
ncbi:MAG TPA: helix-turn-helix domain-containing protein [Mesotoga sp.]|jgi:sugar-specific transcriptional regulator TrmB|nr:TrmB family transcriptional regulator [Mesotoga sp.]MDD4041270.1 helix-turn-helix domain-containing protein [Mesotoga sp.]MDD5745407.1 helix-turn-helix domain-containing protein [Mesotoga sp.]HOY27011.1 helix-turn-helix domain-containing protein [Mesotoga sp.]HPB62381.1 helix-turn-helix domain-containing protein [Mesotoga sp.]